jgi:hypothetical protein
MDTDRDRSIRELAYELWERAGRPAGGAEEYWYEAERRLAEQGSRGLREDPAAFDSDPDRLAPDTGTSDPSPAAKPARRPAAR